MRLYVVNCTGQNRIVNYRLDFTVDEQGRRTSERMVPYKSISIPARQQIQFGGDLMPTQLEEIVQQLEQSCGAVNVSDVKTAKKMGVVRLIWSQDRPVPLPVLKDVFDHNMEQLSDMGAKRRDNLALAADATLSLALSRPAPKVELEFESADQDDNFDQLGDGIRVRRNAPAPEAPRKSRARRAA